MDWYSNKAKPAPNLHHLERCIVRFEDVAISQETKGIAKYGQPLDPMDNRWDWAEMAMEELVDAVKYVECERVKRNRTISASISALVELKKQLPESAPMVQGIIDRLSTLMPRRGSE
jgi:hypothetical protein